MQILENFYKLMSKRSDSETKHEVEFESLLIDMIKSIDYFKQNPSNFGKSQLDGDELGRNCVWAFADNHAEKTVIVFGHFDIVGIEQYGDLKSIAYDAEKLMEKLGHLETDSENWIFGRGSCDMKAGIAINLEMLKRAVENPNYPNVLFLAVPDEENMSAGMRHAVTLLQVLKSKFGLNYHCAFLTEPHERSQNNEFVTYSGSAGKMMPMLVAKGIPVHTGEVFKGLNPIGILTEAVKAVEMNTEMADVLYKRMTPPPTFLCMRDLKSGYDVTTPEFAVAYFNWMFLKDSLDQKLNQLKELCVWSMEDAINQFNYSHNEFLRKQGHRWFECVKEFSPDVLLFDELKARVQEKTDADGFIDDFLSENKDLDDRKVTEMLIKSMIEFLEIETPLIVIALLTPFYPAVDFTEFHKEQMNEVIETWCSKRELAYRNEPFFMKICDMSYLRGCEGRYDSVADNMPLMGRRYDIDFKSLSQLDIPCAIIGPWGKDLHQKTERVYKPDLEVNIPELLEQLLKHYA